MIPKDPVPKKLAMMNDGANHFELLCKNSLESTKMAAKDR